MPKPIEFHFDFSSPYSYLASEQIEAVAARHGRTVDYKPVLLGAVFKASGGAPLTEQYGPKASYAKRDFETIRAFCRRTVSTAKPVSDWERGGKALGRMAAAAST